MFFCLSFWNDFETSSRRGSNCSTLSPRTSYTSCTPVQDQHHTQCRLCTQVSVARFTQPSTRIGRRSVYLSPGFFLSLEIKSLFIFDWLRFANCRFCHLQLFTLHLGCSIFSHSILATQFKATQISVFHSKKALL